MGAPLGERLARWAEEARVDPRLLPDETALAVRLGGVPCRPGAEPRQIASWERRHGHHLPRGLRAWLLLSDGLYRGQEPLVHPLTAIGPMIPFARVPDLVVQPESWFELGNPGVETVCIDLAYTWPGGCCPVFASGDDLRGTPPRIVAPGFNAWFLMILHAGGREFWLDPDFVPLGDPWREHQHRTPAPPLPDRLRPLTGRVRPLMHPGADDRAIAIDLGISRNDLEALFRYLQHAPAEPSGS